MSEDSQDWASVSVVAPWEDIQEVLEFLNHNRGWGNETDWCENERSKDFAFYSYGPDEPITKSRYGQAVDLAAALRTSIEAARARREGGRA